MAFWSTEKLKEKQGTTELISLYSDERVKHGAYELSLGSEVFVTSDKSEKQNLKDKEHLVIPPGQFGLLLVKEKVTIPADAIGFISIKAGKKLRGLVNVSGFHVDPGFDGFLKFSVYNAGSQPIRMACGEPIFLIWFSDLDRSTEDIYDGNHAGTHGITPGDVMKLQGNVASPSALDDRLREVERIISIFRKIFYTVIITLILALLISPTANFILERAKEKLETTKTLSDSSTSTESRLEKPLK